MNRRALLAGFSASAFARPAFAAGPLPFERGSWEKIATNHAGKPFVVHFWGLTCAPCLVELPEWGKLLTARADMRLVLIAADPAPQRAEQVEATLTRAGLARAENWSFADRFHERLRYEIDPTWAGELPRTMLVAGNGTRTVLPGVADLKQVRDWLDINRRS